MLRRLLVRNGFRPAPSVPRMSYANRISRSVRRLEAPAAPTIPTNLNSIKHLAHYSSFPNKATFEEVCDQTLESLTDLFEELVEEADHLEGTDVNYSDGVLTVQFGEPYGTYVINRQTPNEQIWLSSPTSGPKRYDFLNGAWVYRHDGVHLHELLSDEISKIIKKPVDFQQCSYSRAPKN
ncbi:hypothetical protein ONE63_005857 [Megalurothrips usitatus]|uniref:ferroxidase n=1 Tax=Megalurothrips usitatus TaxID=439358 RepID=A0AAV7XWV3_9NEOP|nr:hypothetical protein ONE63_005857 [Megalurothrips usitatus]